MSGLPTAIVKKPFDLPGSEGLPKGYRVFAEMNAFIVNTACQWADARLRGDKNVNAGRKIRQSTKFLGGWFYSIFSCCERIENLSRKAGIEAISAVERYEKIANEFYLLGLQECQVNLYPLQKGYSGKAHIIQGLNYVCSRVKAFEQPCDAAFEFCPEFATFINDAILLGQSNAEFKSKFWYPFLKAWRQAIEELDVKGKLYFVDKATVKIQQGKGSHRKDVSNDFFEMLSRSQTLKPLQVKQPRS